MDSSQILPKYFPFGHQVALVAVCVQANLEEPWLNIYEGGDAQTKKWVLMLDHGHCDDDDDINDIGGGDDEEV